MRLAHDIAQIVVKPSRSRIRAVEDRLDQPDLYACRLHFPDLGELLSQPWSIGQRSVESVEVGCTGHCLGLITLHCELHSDTLVEAFSQSKNPRPPVWRRHIPQRRIHRPTPRLAFWLH